MASETADERGFASDKTFEHYRRLATAGAGIIFVEYTYVHRSGRSEPNQLGVDSDAQIDGLREIASIIKATGALAGLQLVHAGGKTNTDLTDGSLQGPSNIVVPVKDRQLEQPTAMTDVEIKLWKSSFLHAAHRAVCAGFDMVEVHSAHGYGINQWLSPVTNHRQDRFGEHSQGRSLLLLEIITAIRKNFPRLLLSARIPGQDFLPNGLTVVETTALAQSLVSAGLDLVNVSSGLGGWRRPRGRNAQGYLIDEAETIQAQLSAPVIGVGGIEDGDFIDDLLATGKVSFAAVGRAILKDPQRWGEKYLYQNLGALNDSACRDL